MSKRTRGEGKEGKGTGRSNKKSTAVTGWEMREETKAEASLSLEVAQVMMEEDNEEHAQEQSDGENVEQDLQNNDEVSKIKEKIKENDTEIAESKDEMKTLRSEKKEMRTLFAAWHDETKRVDLLKGSVAPAITDIVRSFTLSEKQDLAKEIRTKESDIRYHEGKIEDLLKENKELELKIKPSAQVSYIAPRMVSVAFQIESTRLSHGHDLDCFSNRVQELFDWWNENDVNKKWVGPYMCFVQSSGMGKTKLMFEYKKQQNSATAPRSTQQKVAVALILPVLPNSPEEHEEQVKKVFDYILEFDKLVAAIKDISPRPPLTESALKVYDKLDDMLAKVKKRHPQCKRIVLLFDESHYLLENHLDCAAFLFRCVRVWLREKRSNNILVVAVFSGTNSGLTNFVVTGDWTLEGVKSSSRDHQRNGKVYFDKGNKGSIPFCQTTTMGSCLHLSPKVPNPSEYHCAIRYGRPLFTVMANAGLLDKKITVVLSRMLLLDQDVNDWCSNTNTCINLLSSRVQMGQTTMAVTSDLVAKSYANLAGYFEKSETAQLAYLPDPICARLSMCMMDESFECQLPPDNFTVTGKDKKWWVTKLTEIFSFGIVSPEKGDFGEVVVALYMLFCADLLRKRKNDNLLQSKQMQNIETRVRQFYNHFSVSLDDWLYTMKTGGKMPNRDEATPDVSVGFIQVCRNFLRQYRTSWKSLDQFFLRHVYASSTAFYVYPGCPLIDLVIPLRVKVQTVSGIEFKFVPMLVSIKCRSSFSADQANQVQAEFESRAQKDNLNNALFLLIVFGSKNTSTPTFEKVSSEVVNGRAFRVIHVNHDEFGLNEAFLSMTPVAQVKAELFSSHPYLMVHGGHEELVSSKAMRKKTPQELSRSYDLLRDAVKSTTIDDWNAFQGIQNTTDSE